MWSVGISVSPCEEAARVGYDERQINRIVIRIAQYFLDRNMRVIFGHDWREDGVMRAVADFAVVVAAQAETVEPSSDRKHVGEMGNSAELRMLNVVPTKRGPLSRMALQAQHESGGVLKVISSREGTDYVHEKLPEASAWYRELDGQGGRAAELTALRLCLTALLNPGCRICLGGRTTGYQGDEPGVAEEARLALRYSKPLYLMGGFGGATRRFGEDEQHRGMAYWSTANGLGERQKQELFETTDIERAILLISTGIQYLGGRTRG